jgi:dinuclear metal center YbgI/SA1388 family protein
MRIKDIINIIENFAPLSLQESFDNAGIQVGDINSEATGAVLCLDVTESVVDEAIEKNCNLIISHHPLFFKPFKSVSGATYIERCLIKACKHDIVIYSAHTNLDNAGKGVNFYLAGKIGLEDIKILCPQRNQLLKIVTFVPENHAESVREAIFSVGAGSIGNYDYCSYNTIGKGTFRAGINTSPYCGKKGEIHTENETRIETIIPAYLKSAAIKALINAHPYEEPAFDIYPLANEWKTVGSGAIGHLPEEEDTLHFLNRIKKIFNVSVLKHSPIPAHKKTVRRVALCGGSGAFLIPNAIASSADIFITGEARYNDFFDVEDRVILAVLGHYETEEGTKELLHSIISEKNPTFALHYSNAINSNPIKYL